MKKVYLALSSLLAIGLLAACGGSKGSTRDYVLSEGKKVVDEEMMQANYNQNKKYGKVDFKSYEWKVPDGYTLVSEEFSSNGVYILEKDGKTAIYSALGNKFLLDAKAINLYDVDNDSVTGLFAKYNTADNNYVLADGVGNVLYQSTTFFVASMQRAKTTNDLGETVSLLKVSIVKTDSTTSERSYEYRYFQYDQKSLKATQIDCPDYWANDKQVAGDDYNNGATYDLNKYGIKRTVKKFGDAEQGYTLVAYDEEGKEEATFRLNEGFELIPYGCNFIAERATEVGMEIGPTTYPIKGGTNFKVEHKFINLRDLKQSDLDLPALIQNERFNMLKPYELTDDEYYSVVTLQEVKEDGSLGDYRTMIIDEDFDLHDDITFKNFVEWKRMNNGYFYDETNKIVYDNEFNPVFNARSLTMNYQSETFFSTNTVVSLTGKRMFDARYNGFNTGYSLNGVYRVEDNRYKKVEDETVLANSNDGTIKTLENTDTVAEKLLNSAIGFFQRAETGADGTKGILKTYDGQAVITTATGFNATSGFQSNPGFYQTSEYIDQEYCRSFLRFTYTASEGGVAIVYNELLEVTTL